MSMRELVRMSFNKYIIKLYVDEWLFKEYTIDKIVHLHGKSGYAILKNKFSNTRMNITFKETRGWFSWRNQFFQINRYKYLMNNPDVESKTMFHFTRNGYDISRQCIKEISKGVTVD